MGEKINKEILIELVRNEPALWNKREKVYNNRDLKPDLWDKIGKSLNTTGKVAQKSWETLRDSYRKIRKKAQSEISAQGVKKDISWPHYNAMCFLDDMLTPREMYPGMPSCSPKREPIEDKYDGVEKELPPDEDDDCYAKESCGEVIINELQERRLSSRSRYKRKRRYTFEREDADRQRVHGPDPRLLMTDRKYSETDDDYLFLMSLLPYLKKLDDVQKMKLRIEILRSVTEELENSKYQEVSASSWHPTAFAVTQGGSSSRSSASSRPATPVSSPGVGANGYVNDSSKRQRHSGFINTTGG